LSNWKIKYRPETEEDFVGNAEILEAFVNDISDEEDRPRAYFIPGPYGIGKTTLARIGAKCYLKADDFNITEINGSSNNGIDMVRSLEEACANYTTVNRIWIIDEFHGATKQAQKAFLKLLEEGSKKDFFFICTTEPTKVIPMIISRCNKYPLNLPEDLEIKKRLRVISKKEGIRVSPEVTLKILEKAEGHVRDAVGFLQSVHKMDEDKAVKYLDRCSGGESSSPEAFELVKAIYSGKDKTMKKLLKELKANEEQPEGLRRFIMSYGSTVLLNRWDIGTGLIMENFEKPYFDANPWPQFILDCFRSTLQPE